MSSRILSRSLKSLIRWAYAGLVLPLAIAPLSAHADQLIDQHDQLVKQFETERHANPLIADCAAHASFVVSTAPGYDSVVYPPTALDADHAHIEPWQKPFDDRKQRINVSTVVTIDALGHRPSGKEDPIHIRCGYNEGQLMAFTYKAPLPQVEPVHHYRRKPVYHRRYAHHRVIRHRPVKKVVHAKTNHRKASTTHTVKRSTSGKHPVRPPQSKPGTQ